MAPRGGCFSQSWPEKCPPFVRRRAVRRRYCASDPWRAPSSIRSNLVFRRDSTKLHFFRSSTTKFELEVNFKMARTKMVSNPVSNNPKNVAPASFPFTGQAHTGMRWSFSPGVRSTEPPALSDPDRFASSHADLPPDRSTHRARASSHGRKHPSHHYPAL